MEPKRKKPDDNDDEQVEISSSSSSEEQSNQSIQKTESKSKKPRISPDSNQQKEGVNKHPPIVYGSRGVSVEKMMKNKRAGYPNNYRVQKQPAVLQEEIISDDEEDDDLNIQETRQELSSEKKKRDSSQGAVELKRKQTPVYRTASSRARGIQGTRMIRNKTPYTSLRIRAQNHPGVLLEETISDHKLRPAAISDEEEDDKDLKVQETKQELSPNKKKRDIDTQSESSPVVKSNRSKKARIPSELIPQDGDDDPVIPGKSSLTASFYRALKLQDTQNSSMTSPGINDDDPPDNDLPNSLVPKDN